MPPSLVPFLLALGPTVFALILAWREGGGAVRRLLRTAVTRPNRRVWYGLIALPVAWALAVVGVSLAFGEPSAGLFDKVFPAIVIVPLVVLLPAFAEEIAWRGYAVNRLLPIMPPLAAAFVLGIPWATIHLFLQLPDQMNAGLDWWPTMVSLVAYSVILTWAYVASGGSVLLTALVHAAFNGMSPLMAGLDIDRAWIIRALLVAAVAVAIVVLGGFRRSRAA
jgi:membrane protease YdiL (CAAX protease family)